MGYTGEQLQYDCSKVGMWANPNNDAIPPESFIYPSRNINLHTGGVAKRGGTSIYNSAQISGAVSIYGYDFILRNGNQFMVAGTSDGKIVTVNSSGVVLTLKTGLTANRYYTFTQFNDKLYICNGIDIPQVWDGIASSTYNIGTLGGITAPTAPTTALAGAGAGSVDNGTHTWKVTYVLGIGESIGGTASNPALNVTDKSTNGKVSLTNIPLGPTGTVARKIYRTKAGAAGLYYLVDTINDNSTTTYTDNTADAYLGIPVPTKIPTDWTGTNFPQVMIKHGTGNSEQLWALGCSSTPNSVYASMDNDGVSDADFSDNNVTVIYIETGDGYGIMGGIEYQSRLIVFGKRNAFLIDDIDVNRLNWGYQKSSWEGGTARHRVIVKTPNDAVCMMEDGEIYSVSAVQTTGDYKVASLSRPSFMHLWIQQNVDLTQINKFHAIYDPVLRAIKFFVQRIGSTGVTTALVYFIDKTPDKAWAIHEGTLNASGYSASSSWIRQKSIGQFSVYTGDANGYVWELETISCDDNGVAYYGGIMSPDLFFDSPRTDDFFDRMWIVAQAMGNYNIFINLYVDSVLQTQTPLTMSLSGVGSYLGTGQLGSFVLGGVNLLDSETGVGIKGKRLRFEIFNNGLDQSMYLSRVMIDFRPLGARV